MSYINGGMYVRGPKTACSNQTGVCTTDTDGSVSCGNPAYACDYPNITSQDPKCTRWNYSPCNFPRESKPSHLYLDRRQKEVPSLGPCNNPFPTNMCGIEDRRQFRVGPCSNSDTTMAKPPLPPPYPGYLQSTGKEGFVSGRYRRKGNQPAWTRDMFHGCQFNVRPEQLFRFGGGAGRFDMEEAARDMVYYAQDDQVYPGSLTEILKGYKAFGTPEYRTPAMRSDPRACATIKSMKYQAGNNCPDWYPTNNPIDTRYQCS